MSAARPMRMRNVNGAATTTPERVSVARGLGQYLRISNLDATNNLEISFDGGRNFYTISPTDPPLDVNAIYHFFFVKSSTGTVNWAALLGEG